MADVNGLIPKKIKLIVNKGQDLQLYHPKKHIKNQPRRWRVLFLGVVEKLATAKVDSETGNPEWLCEISITAKNAHDPISLLVTDSKGRHIGQVLIPLVQIPPQPADCVPGTRPPLVFSNIHKSELEPTNKNSYPKGFLYYWMWAEEYWKPEDILKMKSKKSLSRSMHDLSNSTLNLFRRRKSTTSFQESDVSPNNVRERASTDTSLRASALKVNNLKKRTKTGSESSASVISRAGTMPNSPVANGYISKNPFDMMTTTDISIESIREKPKNPFDTIATKDFSIENNIKQEEPYVPGKAKQGLFTKFRFKKSQSSTDISMIVNEKEPPLFHAMPNSLGKQEGHRVLVNKTELSQFSVGVPSHVGVEAPTPYHSNDSRRLSRPQSCSFHENNGGDKPYDNIRNTVFEQRTAVQNHEYKSNTFNGNLSFYNAGADTPIANKNREVMNKRELIDLITHLENQLKMTSDSYRTIERTSVQLNQEKKNLHDELSMVKDELCHLKLKLLEAGDTKYLEKTEPKTRQEILSDLTLWRRNSKI